jgi:hypothetical protein
VKRALRVCSIGLVFLSTNIAGIARISGATDLLEMELSARADAQQRAVHDQPGTSPSSPSGTTPRPSLTAKANGKLRIQWSATNGDKTARLVDVTLHLVLDKPGSEAIYESALVVDLTQTKTTGDVLVQVPQQTGDYRLRLETIGAAKVHGHEHVAAMDVKVVQ